MGRPPNSPPLPSTSIFCFFFNDTATTEIYTLSLHDALPIYRCRPGAVRRADAGVARPHGAEPGGRHGGLRRQVADHAGAARGRRAAPADGARTDRSEEHTSELQSHSDLVCRLLLEIRRAHV